MIMEKKLRKIIRQLISESLSEHNILTESYTLVLKNNHPNLKIDKKFTIDFSPTTLFGKWDSDKIMKAVNNDSNVLVSGTDLEIIDSKGKSIKKGTITGWVGEKLVIR